MGKDSSGTSVKHDRTNQILPLLLYRQQAVLLPGGVLKIDTASSLPLCNLLRGQNQGSEFLVAAIPYKPSLASDSNLIRENDDTIPSLDTVHHIGVAARVVQIIRNAQTGTWETLVEGLHRVAISQITIGPEGLYLAQVQQLDYHKRGQALKSPSNSTQHSEQQDLVRSLLRGTRRLLYLAQGQGRGTSSTDGTAQLLRLLQAQSPAVLSDRIGSLVARTYSDRLDLLSTVDVTQRLRLVLALLHQLLDVADTSSSKLPRRSPPMKTSQRGNSNRSVGGGDVGRIINNKLGRAGLPSTSSSQQPVNKTNNSNLNSSSRPAHGDSDNDSDTDTDHVEEEDDDIDGSKELDLLLHRLKAANPPLEVLKAAQREYRRLLKSSEHHPGYAAALSYLETLADIPWTKRTTSLPTQTTENTKNTSNTSSIHHHHNSPQTLAWVREQLDADHYGMDKVKTRIVQYVAVHRLKGWDARAPILCLVGPPGVGKTSLASGIACVLKRPFQRISLGGVRDEAEIRGHRRTYIGAMPGRITQALRKAGVCDPLLLLDEVDKLGKDSHRGDPASALLEVLDPEQNSAFVDTYLALPLNLSATVFVATANSVADIPPPLLDRMELVQLSGYTTIEKLHIAQRHLVPKALTDHGLVGHVSFPPSALSLIIEGYTREAGVRGLTQCLAAVCRHLVVAVVSAYDDDNSNNRSAAVEQEEEGGVLPAGYHHPSSSSSSSSVVVVEYDSGDGSEMRNSALHHHTHSHAGPAVVDNQDHMMNGCISINNVYTKQVQQDAAASAGITETSSVRRSRWPSSSLSSENLGFLGPGSMGLVAPLRTRNVGLTKSSHKGQYAATTSTIGSKDHGNTNSISNDDGGFTAPYEQQQPLESTSSLVIGNPSVVVDASLIEEVLGPLKYHGHDAAERVATPGVAAGLVYTAAGGKVQYIECLCVGTSPSGSPGTLTLTGQVGDVLEESARIALSWVRHHAAALGLISSGDPDSSPAQTWNVHCHLPAGAISKDGPSAGITIAVALISLFTGRTIREDVAMTGELTLRGLVLPVGGLKEKLLAAHNAGMKRVIVPARNVAEIAAEVPLEVKEALEVRGVERLEEVLKLAFSPGLEMECGALAQAGMARL